MIALSSAESYVGEILGKYDIGWWVSHGDVAGMIAVLRQVCNAGSERLRATRQTARDVTIHSFLSQRALAAICDVLESVAPRAVPASHCNA